MSTIRTFHGNVSSGHLQWPAEQDEALVLIRLSISDNECWIKIGTEGTLFVCCNIFSTYSKLHYSVL